MDPELKRNLISKRGIAKSKLTNIKKYVDAQTDGVDVFNLSIRLNALQKAWDEYNDVQDQLEINDTSNLEIHAVDREIFSDSFYDLHARISKLIKVDSELETKSQASGNSVANSQTSHNLKLPTIKLPTFSNNVLEFRHFHDTFNTLVVNNAALDDIQRYYYLLSSVSGEAHSLIENLPVTSDNFNIAWKLICERYDNPRLVATTHVKALLNPPIVERECPQLLRQLLNHCKSNVNAIEALQLDTPLHELIISQLYLEKVDNNTRKDWELRSSSQEIVPLDQFLQFLEQRCQALELLKSTMPNVNYRLDQLRLTKPKDTRQTFVATDNACILCKRVHYLYKCSKFREATYQEKIDIAKENNLCFNCLSGGHTTATCPSENRCRQCGKLHHTLIHKYETEAGSSLKPADISRQHQEASPYEQNVSAYCSFKRRPATQVLLATAQVTVLDNAGNQQTCRALLDSASQTNFVTESLVQRLRIRKERNQIPIQGISEVSSKANYSVRLQVQSTTSHFRDTITCSVLPSITGNLPSSSLSFHDWNIPDDIQLADPNFYEPGRVDLLLGADLFFTLLRPERRTRPGNYPVLQNTELGWILSGKIQSSTFDTPIPHPKRSFLLRNDVSLDKQLQRFWELEDLPCKTLSANEELCEGHFKQNTARDTTGRYIVRLPRHPDQTKLGESYSMAMKRLVQLERRLMKQPDVRLRYSEFMNEYEALGHMKEVKVGNNPEPVETFYLPHHAVFKASSSTTSTRVVFDGSAPSSNGLSLNDTLLVGPTIQQDIYSIVLRFRTRPIAMSADISKMFRQVQVDSSDTPLQRILWRASPDEPIKIYELNTVTYGTSCAPFLATRTLHQLAEDEEAHYAEAAKVLRRDFYVDDLITATGTINEALKLQKDIIALLERGGFQLRKFSANHTALLEAVPPEYRETSNHISLDNGDSVKTLGLQWNPSKDQFLISSPSSYVSSEGRLIQLTTTKREIASIVASTFDPLGLISPIVMAYKIFLQNLWLTGLGWDDKLPQVLYVEWSHLLVLLSQVKEIRIDRPVIKCDNPTNIQIHGFCDASERGYGACLYLRSTDQQGRITSNILCSKSRVAPVRQITLPRLELCGAVLLAKLIEKTIPILELTTEGIYLHTDSTIVLAWIKASPTRWKTFVANRVSFIQEHTTVDSWRHVSTQENPADLISRGVDPSTLQQSKMWWQGPEWLVTGEEPWKKTFCEEYSEDVPEQRLVTSFLTTVDLDDITKRYSSYTKLIRVMAYCKRFINNCHRPSERLNGSLSVLELHEASLTCIKLVQQVSYPHEIKTLQGKGDLHTKSNILNLSPFIDDMGLLRVGGRLVNSDLPYDSKHQLILPPHHHFTKLLIQYEHIRLLHGGNQLVLSSLRTRYWVPRARQTIRSVLHKCLPCFKLKANSTHQLMGQLPKSRVQTTRPFMSTGVDFAGPINMKIGSARSKQTQKCYIAIFVCFVTRAVHIELVTSLKSEAFIAALRRFVARRGHVRDLYSDNGTSFVGACKELSKLRTLFQDQQFAKDLKENATTANLMWHFIPPQSPHFGGLWESAVKSMKYHFRRVIGQTTLTYEELSTLLTQIEACLNSRPLCALSDDPNDTSVLTPGHFLIGAPLMSLPHPDVTELNVNRLSRWQHLQQMQQHWWSRWSKDYLHTLQQRKKWASTCPNLQPGTLVLVKDDNQPPMNWKLGVIDKVFPGTDGIVRVASIRCGSNVIKRAIHKLIAVPSQ